MKKICNIFTIIFFCIVISLPLLFINHGDNRKTVSALENKTLAKRPRWKDVKIFDKDFCKLYDEWFTDNIGFKDAAVMGNIALKYTLFGDAEIPNLLIGKDKNTYYMLDSIMRSYQGLDRISEDECKNVFNIVKSMKENAKNKNITFAFMPIPNKDAIYPEYMPDSINRFNEKGMLMQLKDYLLENCALGVVDVEKALLEEKEKLPKEDMLYYKNGDGSHWNILGAMYGYEALMDTLIANDNGLRKIPIDQFIIEKNYVNKPFMYLQKYKTIQKTFRNWREYEYVISPIGGFKGVQKEADLAKRYWHYENKDALNDKTILFYADSYIYSFLLPILSETFSQVYLMLYHNSDKDTIDLFVEAQPDIIVYAVVARMIDYGAMFHHLNRINNLFLGEVNN